MKALTVCQPHAHLIAIREKRVENRTWPTSYRGPLLIHAGKSREWLTGDDPRGMVFGSVIARATLADCLHINRIRSGQYRQQWPWLEEHEHTDGPWCWVLEDVRPLDEPVPARGRLGLWDIPWQSDGKTDERDE
jgi:hypothetical protein